MIVLCVGTDVVPAISLGYEVAEIDIMTRRPRKKSDHLISIKIIVHAYLLMGPIAFGAGCVAYFTTFN
jgi:sodium/potassium-transporting ATPase subunit alpha